MPTQAPALPLPQACVSQAYLPPLQRDSVVKLPVAAAPQEFLTVTVWVPAARPLGTWAFIWLMPWDWITAGEPSI